MKRVSERHALFRVSDRVEAQRELAPHVWNAIEGKLIKLPSDATHDTKVWFPRKVPRVSALPTETPPTETLVSRAESGWPTGS